MRITYVVTYFFIHENPKMMLFAKATILINENDPVVSKTIRIFMPQILN